MTSFSRLRIVLIEPLRKEPLIAAVLGSLIGIGFAFGVWKFRSNDKTTSVPFASIQQPEEEANPTTNEFTITSPSNFAATSSSEIVISGHGSSGALVVAYGEEAEIANVTDSGEFSTTSELSEGINRINVWSFEKGQSPKSLDLVLVYEPNLDNSQNKTTYFGTVTDITGDTLQIRTAGGEISQLSLGSDTLYVKIVTESKDIEFSDLAIGDYIAAIGDVGSSVMNVSKVIVTTEPEAIKQAAIIGKIQTLSSDDFIVETNEKSEQISIDATGGKAKIYRASGASIDSARLNSASEGDEIVIIGEFEDDELLADTIILL